MIQLLPFVGSDSLKNVIDSINRNQMFLSTGEWGEIPNGVFPYAQVIEEYSIQTECGCSKEMFLGFLLSVETEDLKLSIKINKSEELECGICGNKYLFNTDDLEAIVKMKDGI